MKVYVATRFKGEENKAEVEDLCTAVRKAGMTDFCFVRDVENYKKTFDDPKELWQRAYDEINACDAFLIDVSDHPTGGRVVEAGIAYALKKRVFIVVKQGVAYKQLFDGISSIVITYDTSKDITQGLKKYDRESKFNVNDQGMMLVLLLSFGGFIGWLVAQVFIPLAAIWAIIYWLAVRQIVKPVRAYDRIVIYIPLAAVWLSVFSMLLPIDRLFAWAWAIGFWFIALLVLRKLKLAL